MSVSGIQSVTRNLKQAINTNDFSVNKFTIGVNEDILRDHIWCEYGKGFFIAMIFAVYTDSASGELTGSIIGSVVFYDPNDENNVRKKHVSEIKYINDENILLYNIEVLTRELKSYWMSMKEVVLSEWNSYEI